MATRKTKTKTTTKTSKPARGSKGSKASPVAPQTVPQVAPETAPQDVSPALLPKNALSSDERLLVDAAIAVRDRAYAPYSRFHVGAAIRGRDGHIYVGCNVENASYGATICAERNAIAAAVAAGEQAPVMIAITATSHEPCPPCGMCRQVLSEFGPELPILLVSDEGNVQRQNLAQLLPLQFHPRYLPPTDR